MLKKIQYTPLPLAKAVCRQSLITLIFSILAIFSFSGCVKYSVPISSSCHPANPNGESSNIELSSILEIANENLPKEIEMDGDDK